jgi:hypothetical protein
VAGSHRHWTTRPSRVRRTRRIALVLAAGGIDVLTVPAADPVPTCEMPLLVAREIPAFWTYYLRECLG